MKRAITSILFIFSMTTGAYAACPWPQIGALGMDIKQGRDLLTDFGACQSNCKGLEAKLNNSVIKLTNNSACAPYILTAENIEMINFISSRSRLIKKQKSSHAWASKPTAKPLAPPVDNSEERAVYETASFTESQPMPAPKQVIQPRPQKPEVTQQTKMAISPEAYGALFTEESPQSIQVAQQNARNQALRQQQQANYQAKQNKLKQERLDQKHKHALIKQQKLNMVRAKKLAMHKHLIQQRLVRLQLHKKRALQARLTRQRIQRQKMARAKR